MREENQGASWSKSLNGTLAAGLSLPALASLVGLARGLRELYQQGYVAQGVPALAARTLVDPALELLPQGLVLGLALAVIHRFGVFLSGASEATRETAFEGTNRVGAYVGSIGALWALLRSWRPDGVAQSAVLLATSAAMVWFLMRATTTQRFGVRLVSRVWKAAGLVLICVLLLCAATALGHRLNRPQGPNIVLIVVDTLRFDHLGFGGYERQTSPALDALAAESIRFERSYSAAPWTSPSVAALMTSRHPGALGYGDSVTPARLGARELLLPEILSDRGYATDAIVSHTYVAEPLGFDQGFDSFDSENALGHHHVSSPSLLAKALAKLDRRAGRPFFLFLHLFDPHFAYLQHDREQGFDFDPRYTGPIVSDLDYGRLLDAVPQMTADDIRHVRALYDSEIAYTDRHLGGLLEGLDERGLSDNTVIVLTGDHGEAFLDREDGWIGHGISLYDELIRVPLLVRPAGGLAAGGRAITGPVGLVDVAPTLLAAAGVEPPTVWQPEGRAWSLAAVVDGEDETARSSVRPVFAETLARGRWLQAVVWEEWKLVWDRRAETWQLFDLISDPGERRNLAGERADIRDRLGALLEQWAREQQEAKLARSTEEAKFTEQQRERLEALGYIE